MVLSQKEKGIINFSVLTEMKYQNGQPVAQNYSIAELPLAIKIREKITEGMDDNKFVESEIDFSTEEKAFLIKRITREWSIEDGKIAIELIEKLK